MPKAMQHGHGIRLVLAAVVILTGVGEVHGQYYPGSAPEDSTSLQRIFEKGQADARRDLAAGLTKIKEYSLPMPWDGHYRDLLAERYGVTLELGPDAVMADEDAYWTGYNGVVLASLKPTYGSDFLNQTYREVESAYYRIRPGEALNPEILRNQPRTQEAIEAGITGSVAIRFDIMPDGQTVHHVVLRGLGYGLDERAIAIVQQLRFEPAEDMEHAVPMENYSAMVRFE